MIPVAGLVFGLAVGVARRGSLAALGEIRFRAVWLLLLALVIQLLIFPWILWSEPPVTSGTGPLHVLSYVLMALFFVLNRTRLWPILPGMGTNLAAIAANGGYMPASVDAMRRSGRIAAAEALAASETGTLSNVVAMGETTRLNVLGDWLYLPAVVPMSTSFSVGDVLLVLGIAWIIQAAMTSSPNTQTD